MTQHDYDLATVGVSGPSYTNDLENALRAVGSWNKGASRPTTGLHDGMVFHNSGTGVLEILRPDLTTWVTILPDVDAVNSGLALDSALTALDARVATIESGKHISTASISSTQSIGYNWTDFGNVGTLTLGGAADWSATGIWTCPETGFYDFQYHIRATDSSAGDIDHFILTYTGQQSTERILELDAGNDGAIINVRGVARIFYTATTQYTPEIFLNNAGVPTGNFSLQEMAFRMEFVTP